MKKFLSVLILVVIAPLFIQSCSIFDTYKDCPEYVMTITQGDEVWGDIVIDLYEEEAPEHSRNFDSLVSIGFYDGTVFHRVIPGFMIQGGDPRSKKPYSSSNLWGTGFPDQRNIKAEFSDSLSHKRGILSAARSMDPNSATSQFFICVAPAPHLDKQYSIYGEVLSGMEIVDRIVNAKRNKQDRPFKDIKMKIVKRIRKELVK